MATTTTESRNTTNTVIIIVAVLLAVIAGAYFMDSNRTADGDETRVERAVDEFRESGNVSEGVEELEGTNDTALERAGDSIGDAVNDDQ